MRNRVSVGVIAVIASACGSSTGPPTLTPAQLARHIDSLAVAARSVPNGMLRSAYLQSAEIVPANGGTPVSVVVTTKSGPHQWRGYMLQNVVSGNGGTADTTYIVYAYSDDDFTSLLIAAVTHTTASSVALVTADTVGQGGGSGTVMGVSTSTGGQCALTPGLENYPTPFPAGTCFLGSFRGSVSWTFPQAAGLTADFQTVSISLQAFQGIELQ